MALVLVLVLLVAVAVAVDLAIPPRPAWATALADRRPEPAAQDVFGPPPTSGLFSRELIQQRLDLLAAELQRLETDRSVFARAFRTYVAKDAYDALLADRTRLARVTTIDLGGVTFDDDVPRVRAMREELEL